MVITSHIYTKHGTFWPMIKAVSKEGFQSKWYTNDANEGYDKLEDLTFNTGLSTVEAGKQDLSTVREEKAGSDKIPHFLPANRSPIAVLKSDRKRVYAGIDNDVVSGTSPLIYAYSTASGTTPTVTIEATSEESSQIREYVSVPLQNATTVLSGN